MDTNKEVGNIKQILGKNLVSLLDYNNGDETRRLVICQNIGLNTLINLKQLANKPIVFTEDEIINAADVFPIEFLNIKKHHILLYGKDIFDDIEITKEKLRHQLEFEFRSKLFHLRQSYMLSDGKDLEEIILQAVPTMAPIIGALMYMKDIPTKYSVDTFKTAYGIDTQILAEIRNIRIGKAEFKNDKDQYITELINVLEQIGKKVDELEVT